MNNMVLSEGPSRLGALHDNSGGTKESVLARTLLNLTFEEYWAEQII